MFAVSMGVVEGPRGLVRVDVAVDGGEGHAAEAQGADGQAIAQCGGGDVHIAAPFSVCALAGGQR